MTVTINGTTGITSDTGYSGDGVTFADGTPANTLVTTTGGNVGIGTSSPTFNSVNGTVCHINNSTAGAWAINHYTNGSTGSAAADGFVVGNVGADAYVFNYEASSVIFGSNSAERMRIDSSGNVLVTNPAGLGYGTGSGGTVTQATSKGTGVTLNKPAGQITMNNAALAAGATATFLFTNSLIATQDVLALSLGSGDASGTSYQVWVSFQGSGSAYINLKNTSGGSRSEAVIINFAVIKVATS